TQPWRRRPRSAAAVAREAPVTVHPNSHVQSVVLKKLEMVSAEMGPAQRRVAEYVLRNPEDVIHMSITQLSGASEASEATIVRLVQDIGFKGYNDFKISLSRSMRPKVGAFGRGIDADSRTSAIIQIFLGMTRTSLLETWEALEPDQVDAAIQLLS